METEIYFSDLKEEVQEGISLDRKTTKEELIKSNNFDVVPLAVIEI